MRTTKEHIAELRRVFVGLNDELVAAVESYQDTAMIWRGTLQLITTTDVCPNIETAVAMAHAALKEPRDANH